MFWRDEIQGGCLCGRACRDRKIDHRLVHCRRQGRCDLPARRPGCRDRGSADIATNLAKEAAALRDALARRDCTAIRHASHRMKGLARLVAAASLAAVCERLERQARDGRVDDAGAVLAEFEREWHRVSDFVNAATPT